MPAARSFIDLLFWQRARQWSKEIYFLTEKPPFCRDQRLVIQINDSSESTFANMAEGFGRGTQEEFITFLGYSIGSLDETQSHLCAAYDRAHIDKDTFAKLWSEGVEIRKMTVAFIRSMILPRAACGHSASHRAGRAASGKSMNASPASSDRVNLTNQSPKYRFHRGTTSRPCNRQSVLSTPY